MPTPPTDIDALAGLFHLIQTGGVALIAYGVKLLNQINKQLSVYNVRITILEVELKAHKEQDDERHEKLDARVNATQGSIDYLTRHGHDKE
jgi:hypothetical protein